MKTVIAASRTTGLKFWSVLGALWVLLFAYVLWAWISGPYFVANTIGRDAAPPGYVALVAGLEIFAVTATLLVVFFYIVWPLVRTGKLSWDGLFFLAAVTLNLQESWLNYTQIQLNYSTVFINYGSWNYYTPGWNAPYPERIPYAIVALGTSYMWLLGFCSLLFSKFMGWLKTRKPEISHLHLIGATFLACCLWCFMHETTLLHTGLVRYGSVVPSLTLFAGKDYQYPIYEMLSWAACFLVLACLRYYRDDNGYSFVEKGVDELKLPSPAKTLVRWLAIVGFMQTAMFLVYNVPMNYWATQVVTLKQMPEYLRAGMCGPKTDYDCPDADVPMARRHSPTNRIHRGG